MLAKSFTSNMLLKLSITGIVSAFVLTHITPIATLLAADVTGNAYDSKIYTPYFLAAIIYPAIYKLPALIQRLLWGKQPDEKRYPTPTESLNDNHNTLIATLTSIITEKLSEIFEGSFKTVITAHNNHVTSEMQAQQVLMNNIQQVLKTLQEGKHSPTEGLTEGSNDVHDALIEKLQSIIIEQLQQQTDIFHGSFGGAITEHDNFVRQQMKDIQFNLKNPRQKSSTEPESYSPPPYLNNEKKPSSLDDIPRRRLQKAPSLVDVMMRHHSASGTRPNLSFL